MFKKKPILFLLFILLSLAFIFLNSKGFLDYPKSAINYLVSPISKSLWSGTGKISHFFSFISNLKSIYSENEYLKNQNRRLLAENAYLKSFIEEKEVLEKAADIQRQDKFHLQASRIVGMDSQNQSGLVIIDVGSENAIAAGMPVITEDKLLVGKVVETDKNFSKVLTVFNPSLKVAVKTQDSKASGISIGDYSKNILMDFVVKEKNLNQNETVLTSAKDGVFPEGLVIGTIRDFQSRPENLFQIVNINSELDVYELDRVLVLTKF